MYIAILGRQPALGMAELERVFSGASTEWFSSQSVLVKTNSLSIDDFGGALKAGRVVADFTAKSWRDTSDQIVKAYASAWQQREGKITLGISTYNVHTSPKEVQKTGIILKQRLKKSGVSIRLIPNSDVALSTATSHHNKLGLSDNKVELLVVQSGKRVIVAESIGAQNITAYAKRDQGRPKRDAFVGMLPPKLAQLIVNLTGKHAPHARILDPFCGTGVVLQEAALFNYDVYGTDLSEKMIDYSKANLEWLQTIRRGVSPKITLHQGDAMETTWQPPIDAVACESYLGQPFSAPPSAEKLKQVQKNCNYIIDSFLRNIALQLPSGTPLCVAVPAWRSVNGSFTHLPLTRNLEDLGYRFCNFTHVAQKDLLYYREDQVVARQLLVLERL